MWWTLTGNFGNMLPIDWSKSYTRKLQINCLNLNEKMVINLFIIIIDIYENINITG